MQRFVDSAGDLDTPLHPVKVRLLDELRMGGFLTLGPNGGGYAPKEVDKTLDTALQSVILQ